jgi:hypothetical protein
MPIMLLGYLSILRYYTDYEMSHFVIHCVTNYEMRQCFQVAQLVTISHSGCNMD